MKYKEESDQFSCTKDQTVPASNVDVGGASGVISTPALVDALQKKDAQAITAMFAQKCSQRFLNLSIAANNDQVRILLEAMKVNSVLSTVSLTHKHVDKECGLILADFVLHCQSLTSFKLSTERIHYEGAQVLVQALLNNKNLSVRFVAANNIYPYADDAPVCPFLFSSRFQNPFVHYHEQLTYQSQRVTTENRYPCEITGKIDASDPGRISLGDFLGRTPLHNAVLFGKIEGVQCLLTSGCDTGIKDNNGDTALDLAKKLRIKFKTRASACFFDPSKKELAPNDWDAITTILSEHDASATTAMSSSSRRV